ncbi:Uncharacterized protein FWK35_00002189 [Aphis craccivora]|uniref:Uncharacterized protein n=1 Tax=Aphis craccivora TaxID=307492 RepID=A0A6G0Z778_APHCR|nr:Uncharacterized protein FWK35_00002189 [Aphis craccivora]
MKYSERSDECIDFTMMCGFFLFQILTKSDENAKICNITCKSQLVKIALLAGARDLDFGITHFLCKSILCLYFISFHENQPKSKMGAEKVSMNIVVVGQVQSAKAVKIVAKAAPATSQSMKNVSVNQCSSSITNSKMP